MAVDSNTYGAVAGVEGLARELTKGSATAGTFDTSTVPTLAQVEALLDDGARLLNLRLAGLGFTTPVTDTTVKAMLAPVNEKYGLAMAWRSREMAKAEASESTQGDRWYREFERDVKELLAGNGKALITLGIGRTSELSAGLYAGGISIDDKEDVDDDDDRVAPGFKRDQFRYPGTGTSGVDDLSED